MYPVTFFNLFKTEIFMTILYGLKYTSALAPTLSLTALPLEGLNTPFRPLTSIPDANGSPRLRPCLSLRLSLCLSSLSRVL